MKDHTLNSNLILLIQIRSLPGLLCPGNFKFQSDSINTESFWREDTLTITFKFQSDSINTIEDISDVLALIHFKFQSDSINTETGGMPLIKSMPLNSNLILLIRKLLCGEDRGAFQL